jgi:hypothetical protein
MAAKSAKLAQGCMHNGRCTVSFKDLHALLKYKSLLKLTRMLSLALRSSKISQGTSSAVEGQATLALGLLLLNCIIPCAKEAQSILASTRKPLADWTHTFLPSFFLLNLH